VGVGFGGGGGTGALGWLAVLEEIGIEWLQLLNRGAAVLRPYNSLREYSACAWRG